MKLHNKDKNVKAKFYEKMKEKNADAYRVFIEFCYAHNTEFSEYVTKVVNGDIEPYFSEEG